MNIPKNMVPKGNFKKRIEEALKKKEFKSNKIEDIALLVYSAQRIKGFSMDKAFWLFPEDWNRNFKIRMHPYLERAGLAHYWKEVDPTWENFYVHVYGLEFKNKNKLDEFIERDFDKDFLRDVFEEITVSFLRRDNYMVGIRTTQTMVDCLKDFEDWYINNFGMERI